MLRASCLVCKRLFFRFDGADGAAVFTRAAVDADVRIDLILGVALGDGADGAGFCAGAARDAFFRNFMCHCSFLRVYNCSLPCLYYNISAKNSKDFAADFFDFFEKSAAPAKKA